MMRGDRCAYAVQFVWLSHAEADRRPLRFLLGVQSRLPGVERLLPGILDQLVTVPFGVAPRG